MKIEHPLSETHQAYVRRTLQDLQQANTNYLAALGQAAEIKRQADHASAALGQVLKLVEEEARLPTPLKPYTLSEDGTKLVGETADTAAPAAQAAAVLPAAAKKQPTEGRPNGVST